MVKKGILLLSLVLSILFGIMEVQAAGSVTYNGEVTYGPTTVGDFTVNGNLAFCVEHDKPTPFTGISFTDQVYENADMRKVLYYGWNGPAQWSGFENSSHGIVATSIVLSYYYSGSGISTESQSFFEWLQSQPAAPSSQMSLTKSYTEAYLSEDKEYQRTENITLQADKSNYITMSLPEEMKLYNVTKNTTSEGSVVLYGGDTFYLTAPLEMDGTWSSGVMKGVVKNYQPIVCTTSDAVQNLGYGAWVEDQMDTVEFQVKWIPHGQIELYKIDAETGKNEAQGNASLSGAVYEIYNTVGTLKESLTTDEMGKAMSGLLPYDTYIIREVSASAGYLVQEEDVECILNAERVTAVSKEQIIRSDIHGVKIGGGSHKRLSEVPFEITSKTTGEHHTVVTDANGEFDSSGIWFGEGGLKEDKGALLYDTYTITEQPCENNEGYDLIPSFEVTVYRDGQTITLGTLTDEAPEEPGEPQTLEEPEKSETPEEIKPDQKENKTVESVKTGDDQKLIVLIFLLILSCVGILFYGKISKGLPRGKRKN